MAESTITYFIAGVSIVFLVIAVYIFLKSQLPLPHRDRPLLRACPVCGTELKIGENIMAERTGMVREGREKIIIKGCYHCMKQQGGKIANEADYLKISAHAPIVEDVV